MNITLPLKPLSINAAFQGRRFKTKECNNYCKDLDILLPDHEQIKGFVEIHYKFHLVNWKRTDGDNLIKILTDCIVKKGIIEDDRKIMKYIIEKIPSEKDIIEIEIKGLMFFKR